MIARRFAANAVIEVGHFTFDANPDSRMVEAGRVAAASRAIDSIVALGGGSSLDCAKGINFVLTNGGSMRDYRGSGKAARPMLPAIGVPTTAGTGSEAQSYAIISDAETHQKMACGDPKAAFRIAVLDPTLTITNPRPVTAIAGYDALSHAVESFVTSERTQVSDLFAREAWRLIEANYERVLRSPADMAARSAMLLGAHHAASRSSTDAGRDARLRESADETLRHNTWSRHCGHAAARRPLERRERRRSLCELLRVAEHGDGTIDRRWAGERLAERLRPGGPCRIAADTARCRRRPRRPAGAGGGRRGRMDRDLNPRQFDAGAALSPRLVLAASAISLLFARLSMHGQNLPTPVITVLRRQRPRWRRSPHATSGYSQASRSDLDLRQKQRPAGFESILPRGVVVLRWLPCAGTCRPRMTP